MQKEKCLADFLLGLDRTVEVLVCNHEDNGCPGSVKLFISENKLFLNNV